MAAGYAFGPVMELPPDRRRATCIRLGLAAIALFLVVRGTDRYGDQRRWHRTARAGTDEPNGRRRGDSNLRATPTDAIGAGLPQHEQVPGVALVSAHDARSDARLARPRRSGSRPDRARARDVRPRPDVLLSAPHPDDPPRRRHRLTRTRRLGESVVVRQSSARPGAAATRLHVESAAACTSCGRS